MDTKWTWNPDTKKEGIWNPLYNGGINAHRLELLVQRFANNLVRYNKFKQLLELSPILLKF